MGKPGMGAHKSYVPTPLPRTVHSTFVEMLVQRLDKVCVDLEGYTDYRQAARFKASYLRENLLSKFVSESTTSADQRRQAAITKWLAMDDRNNRTNTRLLALDTDFGWGHSERVKVVAREVIRQVIGSSPDLNILRDGQFTNGASTRVKRGPTAIAEKYVGDLHVTREAWPYFRAYVLDESPFWSDICELGLVQPKFVDASVMFTVPKNSEIDRVACKEPEINMFLQRAVGNYFREKLRRNGIDLNDQSRNRGLAREASRARKLATIDLSSASDLISSQLVFELLPFGWFDLLNDLRVKYTMIDDTRYELNMFSSMGNGFTFELESLIFFSLARAVAYLTKTRGRISVYGDDIIVPRSMAGALVKCFQWFGFKVNTKKSFWRGQFNESCGGHYFAGCDVTPFYIRAPLSTLPDLMLTLNQLRVWATQTDCLMRVYADFSKVWHEFARYVPSFLWGGRLDGTNVSLITPHYPRKRLAVRVKRHRAEQLGALVYWLHRRGEEQDSFFVTSHGSTDGPVRVLRNRTWERSLDPDLYWDEEGNLL